MQKRRTRKIYLLSTLIASADIIGLGSMVPVLMLAIDHSFLEKSRKLRFIYEHFGFTSEAFFLKALIAVILTFFIFKSIMAFLLQGYIRRTAQDVASGLSSRSFQHAFKTRSFEKVSKDGLGFNDVLIFTPYYFVSGMYLPYLTLVTEVSVVVMLTLFFTIYKPAIFVLIAGLLGSGFFLVNRFTRRRITALGEIGSRYREKALKEINYGISGFTDILTHRATEYFRDRMLAAFRDFTHAGIRAINLQTVPARVNELVALSGIIMLVIYAYYFSSDNLGEVRVLAALFAIAVFRLMPSANRILQSLMQLKLNAYTAETLKDVCRDSAADRDSPRNFSRKISISGLSYAYSGKDSLFDSTGFELNKGEITGIKGTSGTGKTTLVKLLLGLLDLQQGRLQVDGTDIPADSGITGLFSYVGQDPYIFDGTVAENVVFGRAVSPEDHNQIREALKMAAFRVEIPVGEDILNLAVGEKGSRISEGQKQRLSIARAIFHNSEVIILDEPSSALDEKTELELADNLMTLKNAGKTILIISHKPGIIDICDRVYQIENRKIIPA